MKKVFEEPKLEMISIYDVVANQLPLLISVEVTRAVLVGANCNI